MNENIASEYDEVQKTILSVFEHEEPRLKLYARWRIAQHRWGSRGGNILPGGIDCDDIVLSALSHLMTRFSPDELDKRYPGKSKEDEIYRRFKRRIDTIISNINRSGENQLTSRIGDINKYYDYADVVNMNTHLKNLDTPESILMSKDFLKYLNDNTENNMIRDIAAIALNSGIVSARDQAKYLNVPISIIYEARRNLKKFLSEYLSDQDYHQTIIASDKK